MIEDVLNAGRALTLLVLFACGACANRGMTAPGDGGRDRTVSDAVDMVTDMGGDSVMPPACAGPVTDGGTLGDGAPACAARFNFEGGNLHGATLAPMWKAFTMPVNSNCQTYCGQGALQVSAAFFQSDAGPGGAGSSGQILLPLVPANAPPGTGQNLTGATITIHLRAVPPDPSGMLNFHLVLLTTSAGSQNAGMTATFTSDQWIAVATPPLALATGDGGADAGNGIRGIDSVYQLSLEFFSFQNYQGKIYVDEVDIQP